WYNSPPVPRPRAAIPHNNNVAVLILAMNMAFSTPSVNVISVADTAVACSATRRRWPSNRFIWPCVMAARPSSSQVVCPLDIGARGRVCRTFFAGLALPALYRTQWQQERIDQVTWRFVQILVPEGLAGLDVLLN